MGEQGFLGTSIAAEKGGIGGTFKDEAIVLEEQIYANCHAPAIGVSKAGLCILRRIYFSDTLFYYVFMANQHLNCIHLEMCEQGLLSFSNYFLH